MDVPHLSDVECQNVYISQALVSEKENLNTIKLIVNSCIATLRIDKESNLHLILGEFQEY